MLGSYVIPKAIILAKEMECSDWPGVCHMPFPVTAEDDAELAAPEPCGLKGITAESRKLSQDAGRTYHR